MRKLIAPALIALLIAAPGAAFAATATPVAASATSEQSAIGIIKSFDLAKHSLILADGKMYQLPTTFKDPGLKVGSKVTVKWQMNGTSHEATSVSLG